MTPTPDASVNDEVARSKRGLLRSGIMAVVGAIVFVSLAGYTYMSNSDQDKRIRDGEQRLTEQSQVIEKQNTVIGQVCKIAGGEVDETEAQQYCSRVESGLPAVPIAVNNVGTKRCDLDLRIADGSTRTVGVLCGPPLLELTVTEGGHTKRCTSSGESGARIDYVCVPLDVATSTVGTTPSR